MKKKDLSFRAIVKGIYNLWVIRDFNIEAETMCKNKQAIQDGANQQNISACAQLRKENA